MSDAEIKFIGSGSGKTSLTRFHSSFIVSHKNYNLLVDAGDGISRAFLSQKISYSFINGILFTHLHPDHYSGLATLVVQMKLTNRENDLHIIIHKNLKQVIEDFLYKSYIFKENLNFNIIFDVFNNDEVYQLNDTFKFSARQNSHLNKYQRYSDYRKLDFSSSSILFEIKGKYILYTGDIGIKEDIFIFKDFYSDIIISEISHISFDDIYEAFGILNPKKLFITHISEEIEELLNEKRSILKQDNIIPVVDGFTFQI
jgi:ribonuclease BN (tRNA processing enzyme)